MLQLELSSSPSSHSRAPGADIHEREELRPFVNLGKLAVPDNDNI